MSKKKLIFDTVRSLGVNVGYALSPGSALPYAVLSFVSQTSTRLSDRKHDKHVRYQLMYFSDRALDVETDPMLLAIESALEDAGPTTTDWMEITEVDEDKEVFSFSYLIEVM